MAAQDRLLIETSERKNDVRISNRARWLALVCITFIHSFIHSLTHSLTHSRHQVETYVYDMRGKISDGGNLYLFAPAEVRENLAKLLTETEDWLYGDGEDATKSVYVARLADLKKIGDPIEKRYHEAEARPTAVAALRGTIEQYLAEARSDDEKYAHIDQAERQKVLDQCANSEAVRSKQQQANFELGASLE